MTLFQQPKNTLPRIDYVYLFVSVDAEDGNEGIVGAPFGGISVMPMIAADEKRLSQLIPIAEQIAEIFQMKIRLIKLSHREVIQEINPKDECEHNSPSSAVCNRGTKGCSKHH